MRKARTEGAAEEERQVIHCSFDKFVVVEKSYYSCRIRDFDNRTNSI